MTFCQFCQFISWSANPFSTSVRGLLSVLSVQFRHPARFSRRRLELSCPLPLSVSDPAQTLGRER